MALPGGRKNLSPAAAEYIAEEQAAERRGDHLSDRELRRGADEAADRWFRYGDRVWGE